MLTLWAYVRYAQNKLKDPQCEVRCNRTGSDALQAGITLALLFFALGLMCKPMLVTLPFVLLLLDYWPLGRISEFGVRRSEFTEHCATLNPPGVKGEASRLYPSTLALLFESRRSSGWRRGHASSPTLAMQGGQHLLSAAGSGGLRRARSGVVCALSRTTGNGRSDLAVPDPMPVHWGFWPVAAWFCSAADLACLWRLGAFRPLAADRLAHVSGHAGAGHRPGPERFSVHR